MFVYIFEDGTVQQHPDPPTEEDMLCVEDGILMVLKCDSVVCVTENGDAELTTCDLSEVEDGVFCHSQA